MTPIATTLYMDGDLFRAVCANAINWDFYLRTGDDELAADCMHRWVETRSRLKTSTGNLYMLMRDKTTVSIVNERSPKDRILLSKRNA